MRRKDREITDRRQMLEILQSCTVCSLGLSDGEQPYVLPLNFGYEWPENGALTLFFHCAHHGRKLDIIAKNSRACFEMDCGHQLLPGERACDYSFRFASLIGVGRARLITEPLAKSRALRLLMERQAGPGLYDFSANELASVTVFCVEAHEVTAKRH